MSAIISRLERVSQTLRNFQVARSLSSKVETAKDGKIPLTPLTKTFLMCALHL